jgi:hypothetical protein
LEQSISYGYVLGCAAFGILWGIVNIHLIRGVDMNDSRHLKKSHEEEEGKPLISREHSTT